MSREVEHLRTRAFTKWNSPPPSNELVANGLSLCIICVTLYKSIALNYIRMFENSCNYKNGVKVSKSMSENVYQALILPFCPFIFSYIYVLFVCVTL